MNRLRYMCVRVLQGLLVLMCIATVNFMLIRAAPGDPVAVIAGEAGASDPQFVAQLRELFGLDKTPEEIGQEQDVAMQAALAE